MNSTNYKAMKSRINLLIVGSFFALILGFVAVGRVHAETPTPNPILDYCFKVAPTSAAKDACNADTAKRVRNVATYQCEDKDVKSGAADKCVTDTAKDYFKIAANSKPKPKTAKAFKKSINSTIAGKGNPNTASTKLQQSINAASAESCPQQSSDFLGFKAWYHYLKVSDSGCDIVSFQLLPTDSKPSDVPLVMLAIIDDLLRIGGLVAVGYVLLGGIKYITSQGDPEGIAKAQGTVINALLGLSVSIIAVAFVAFLGNKLGG